MIIVFWPCFARVTRQCKVHMDQCWKTLLSVQSTCSRYVCTAFFFFSLLKVCLKEVEINHGGVKMCILFFHGCYYSFISIKQGEYMYIQFQQTYFLLLYIWHCTLFYFMFHSRLVHY
jgi:hypothetical protein